ncbi:acyl-CoA synthetase [Candidatus Foliamicus sp.]
MNSKGDKIYDWLAYHARYNADSLACVDLGSGRRFTYAAMNERSTRLATGLAAAHGVSKGDRVAIIAANSTDFYELMFACWKLGALFMPLNWRLHTKEIAALLAHGQPKVLFCDQDFASLAEGWRQEATLIRRQGNGSDYENLISDHGPEAVMPELTGDDLNCLLYTSGTTGRPKGVMYNYRMIHNTVLCASLHAGMTRDSVSLAYAPLFHTAGLNAAGTPLFHFGGCVNVMPGWDAQQCLDYLADPEMGITHCIGVPTHYLMMSELPKFEKARFPSLVCLGVGSAPVPMQLLRTWEAKGVPLVQSYGLTECFSVTLTPPHRAREMLGSAGHAMMHVELQVGDDEGWELPFGEVGEVQLRGPGVTPGYWRDPELTAASWVNGWFRTGDGGRMDEDGTLTIVDRIKDMFISGGENIYPAEIEQVLAKMPAVRMVGVIGVPDPKWGEVGMAMVQPRKGMTITAEDVLEQCRANLARYKIPKHVKIVNELPISPQGKIVKTELRRRYG